jgi:hypothetical protein
MTELALTGSNKLTRRRVTSAAVVGGVTATLVARPTAANAAVTYTPVAYTKTRLAGSLERLIANRFGYGWTPAMGNEIALAGGWKLWFERQLGGLLVDDTFYTTSSKWWPSINASVAQIFDWHVSDQHKLWDTMQDYKRWVLVRRIYSKRQVLESMTDFWENHFHVPAIGEAEAMFRSAYGKGIRQRALGTFEELLKFTTTHPAMGVYLNNATSKKSAPNEDLGRELLELHTLGRGNYTETDVVNSARILTGYHVDVWDTWVASYATTYHWTGPVKVVDFTDANSSPDGRATTMRYLTYLAHHPATAHRIARKLAVRFVSDTPSQALVEQLASVYLANGTAIKPVLRALVASSEFQGSSGRKVRTPDEDVVATYRALRVKITAPTAEKSAANEILWQTHSLGTQPLVWPRPDGRPDNAEAWTSTSRMLGSFKIHFTMAGSWFPLKDVGYATPGSWLPQSTIRFDYLVDHLARKMTGRRSTSTLLRACCQAVDVAPTEKITRDHQLVTWKMPRLLTTLLDHPAHMTR